MSRACGSDHCYDLVGKLDVDALIDRNLTLQTKASLRLVLSRVLISK